MNGMDPHVIPRSIPIRRIFRRRARTEFGRKPSVALVERIEACFRPARSWLPNPCIGTAGVLPAVPHVSQ